MSIAENIQIVMDNVAEAAVKSGRKPEDITVVGVTKTVDAEQVMEMTMAGITTAGENRVQELVAKKTALAEIPDLSWHMIGHLQTNKVRQAVLAADLIQSVDSIRLAEAIDRCAREAGKLMDVLIEVNIAEEASKFGFLPKDALGACSRLLELSSVRVRGLMCVAPYTLNPVENGVFFNRMREISIDIKENLLDNRNVMGNMDILSMGMTGDYTAAILHGATMVRVGTAIFGAR